MLVNSSIRAATVAIGVMLCGATANAQSFTDAGGSFRNHVATICPVLAQQRDTASNEQDLFLRCNGALSQPAAANAGLTGLTDQGAILDQYLGVQGIAQQADAATEATRGDQAVAGRLSAIGGQLRGRQFAGLTQPRAILLASNDPDQFMVPDNSGLRERALDGFLSIGGYDGDQDTTSQELGFDQEGWWIAGGLDYQFSDTLIAGAAISYVDGTADFDSIGGVQSGGSMNSESWSVSAYGSLLATEKLELNGLVSFGQADFRNKRNISVVDRNGDANGGGGQSDQDNLATINRTAVSDSEADTIQLTVGGSYALYQEGGVSFTPTAELSYYNADIDGFSETGAGGLNLTYDSQEVDSLRASVGAIWQNAINTDWGVFVPYARGAAVFELQDDEQSVRARYTAAQRVSDSSFTITTNPADESSFDIAVGASAIMPGGFSAFAEYTTVLGLDNVSHQGIALGLRMEF
ncbi:MAG: autotransporter outer membrane beta-barrel domain-containing protein [Pseudomonadota bacterium]